MKKIIFLILFIWYSKYSYSQFCNTTPTSMGALTLTSTWQSTAANSGAKRYWTFNATAGCKYDFSSCNSVNTNDTYLRLYSGTNPLTATLIASNDDNGPWCTGNKASLSWTCPTTGAYSILFTNFSCANISSNSVLSYRVICPPLNDNCSGAINIPSLPYVSPLTSNNPSTDDVPTSTSSCGTQGSNLWYTVLGNGNLLTASTCSTLTNFDTEIRVYTGNCSSLNSMTEVVCNDDDASCTSSGFYSTVNWCSQPGITYYISVGYFISGTGYGNFILSVSNGAPCTILPIELIEFEGNNMGEYNQISWVTATETDNDYFTLERSLDGLNWITVNTQSGSGTTSFLHSYSYNDYNYIKGEINYYRLSQTDFNGQRKYFNLIAVTSEKDIKCSDYQYYDLLGKEINIKDAPPGLYLRKCGDKTEKIMKN